MAIQVGTEILTPTGWVPLLPRQTVIAYGWAALDAAPQTLTLNTTSMFRSTAVRLGTSIGSTPYLTPDQDLYLLKTSDHLPRVIAATTLAEALDKRSNPKERPAFQMPYFPVVSPHTFDPGPAVHAVIKSLDLPQRVCLPRFIDVATTQLSTSLRMTIANFCHRNAVRTEVLGSAFRIYSPWPRAGVYSWQALSHVPSLSKEFVKWAGEFPHTERGQDWWAAADTILGLGPPPLFNGKRLLLRTGVLSHDTVENQMVLGVEDARGHVLITRLASGGGVFLIPTPDVNDKQI